MDNLKLTKAASPLDFLTCRLAVRTSLNVFYNRPDYVSIFLIVKG